MAVCVASCTATKLMEALGHWRLHMQSSRLLGVIDEVLLSYLKFWYQQLARCHDKIIIQLSELYGTNLGETCLRLVSEMAA